MNHKLLFLLLILVGGFVFYLQKKTVKKIGSPASNPQAIAQPVSRPEMKVLDTKNEPVPRVDASPMTEVEAAPAPVSDIAVNAEEMRAHHESTSKKLPAYIQDELQRRLPQEKALTEKKLKAKKDRLQLRRKEFSEKQAEILRKQLESEGKIEQLY